MKWIFDCIFLTFNILHVFSMHMSHHWSFSHNAKYFWVISGRICGILHETFKNILRGHFYQDSNFFMRIWTALVSVYSLPHWHNGSCHFALVFLKLKFQTDDAHFAKLVSATSSFILHHTRTGFKGMHAMN